MTPVLDNLSYRAPHLSEDRLVMHAGHYATARDVLGLELWDSEGFPFLRVTVNLPGVGVPKDCIAIKSWSENEGIVQNLIQWGVIEPLPTMEVKTGHVVAPVHRLTEEFQDKLRRANV